MPKPNKEKEISSVLTEIDTALKRQNSIVYIFLHGFIRGMGTALGATVLVAFLTSVTLYFAQRPEVESFLNSLTNYIID